MIFLIFSSVAATAKWAKTGVTVARGHGRGNATNQLERPHGFYVDEDGTVVVADPGNHHIVEWKRGDTEGTVLAGGKEEGNRTDQLRWPTDVIVDKDTDSLIICDRWNRRVIRWPRRNDTRTGETIIKEIDCHGLTMDDEGSLYVTDIVAHEVKRYGKGDMKDTRVAGGNGGGARLDQFMVPYYVRVDADHVVYVSDAENHRVMKWVRNAKEGTVVAGDGKDLKQLSHPGGLIVNAAGTVYVVDSGHNRVTRWYHGSKQGPVVLGGSGEGRRTDQFNHLNGLFFDWHGNLYVSEEDNHRVLRFAIENI